MKRFIGLLLLLIVVVAISFLLLVKRTEGPGSVQPLYGVNLGGWLADELRFGPERFDCELPGVHEQLRDNLGQEAADRLIAEYHGSFITVEDFDRIVSNGFNAVRIPISAAHLIDTRGSSERFDRKVKRLEWAVARAGERGLRVIVNLRVRAGDWAPQPAVRGRRFAARWTERDVQVNAVLWSRLADRLKHAGPVAAYDLSPGSCLSDADLITALSEWHNAIREVDASARVIAPWPRPALSLLQQSGTNMTGQGFTAANMEHTANAGGEAQRDIELFLENDIHRMDQYWGSEGLACMVAEYNPAVADAAGVEWLGTYRQAFRQLGWDSMLWTYKSVIFTDTNRTPHASLVMGVAGETMPDFAELSAEEAESFFDRLAKIEFTTDETMQEMLATDAADYEPTLTQTVTGSRGIGDGWMVEGVGGVECAVSAAGEDGFTMTSSGTGTEGYYHEHGFVYQAVQGRATVSAVLNSVELPSANAGAGLMVRLTTDRTSPCVQIYFDSRGRVMSVVDRANGQPVQRRVLTKDAGYNHLRISTDGMVLKASCSSDGRVWPVAANFTVPWLTNRILVGAAVFSGHEYRTASARYENIVFSAVE